MNKAKSLFAILSLAAGIFIFGNIVIVAQGGNQPSETPIDSTTKSEVIETLLKELNARYIFPETAKKMETDIRARQQRKEYDTITNAQEFSRKLTEDLRSISHDKHLGMRFSAQPIPVRKEASEPTAEEKKEYEQMMKINNYGFVKVEVMRGNIGYIDFRGFVDPNIGGAETVAAAMNFVGNADSLIFDVRQNGGGEPEMVALICSYLFGDKAVHLNDLFFREGNQTTEYWTKPMVAGKKFLNKDVYILTSSRTFSAAEEFSNNLKVLKRATIVGETTGGGANPGEIYRLTEHFGAFIPTGRAINPTTKINWEGTGVEPDVKVSQEQALKTAYLLALNKSLEKADSQMMKDALKRTIDQTQKELDEMKNPANIK